MSEFIKRGISFVRRTPSVAYSLFLIVAVTAIVFFNAFYSLNRFQGVTDKLLQSKAVLAEDIFGALIGDHLYDTEVLQRKIGEIKNNDSEVREITVFIPLAQSDRFAVAASTNPENIGVEVGDEITRLAWVMKDGVAYPGSDGGTRFWNVIKTVRDASDNPQGLVSLSMSLEEHDRFIEETISQVYLVVIASLIVVVLLAGNHVRLFSDAVRAGKLEEIDRMKDDFISMASHELKTPLTALRGYADLLKESIDGEKRKNSAVREEQLHYVQNMNLSVSRLVDLVSDILDVSRIDQNRLPIKIGRMELGTIVDKVIEELSISAKEKKLELVRQVQPVPAVVADGERVRQILFNLIGNAIKYTPKGKIEISTKSDDNYVSVIVADTGIGVSAENMKKLFAKFYRVKSEQTSQISGTGLGLWISKELAVKMGGDLSAESIEGVGTHFTLKLPIAKETHPAPIS